jgi:hypothetical protein
VACLAAALAAKGAVAPLEIRHLFRQRAKIASRRTDACQYGSRAELAIIDARQAAPIETSSPEDASMPL